MQKYFTFLFIVFAFLGVGCSSALSIKSSPSNALVTVYPMGQTEGHAMGQTPIASAIGDLPDKLASGKVLVVEIKKEGYHPKTVYVTETQSVDVEVDVKLEKQVDQDNTKDLNELVEGLFDSQKAAQSGDLESAHQILDQLEKNFENVSAIYEMRGGLYLLEKNVISAKKSFGQALSVQPRNHNVRVIVRSLGGDVDRLPASEEEPQEAPKETEKPQAEAKPATETQAEEPKKEEP